VQKEKIKASLPDIKGKDLIYKSLTTTEWDEYMNMVREAEILALGIVRVTPAPRQLSPSIAYNVIPFLIVR
jgi:hypothetical protein